MKRAALCGLFFLPIAYFAADLQAQQSTQSLGELARRERERKMGLSQSATQTVTSEAVGLRLTVPAGWKATENRNSPLSPFPSQLVFDCAPGQSFCSLMVESASLPKSKSAITDTDRQAWDKGKDRDEQASRRISSRDFEVGAYPAHEVIFEHPGRTRSRHVYVLAPNVRRLFDFIFTAGDFDNFASAVESALQSFTPAGQPSEEQLALAELTSSFSPEERSADSHVTSLLLMEEFCRQTLGNYVPIEEALSGCQRQTQAESARVTATVTLPPEEDPRRDPNYEYRMKPGKAAFELSVIPRRAALGGFFSDAQKVYYNPNGLASTSDKVLYDLSPAKTGAALARTSTGAQSAQPETPGKPAPGSKRVWTEEDIQGLSGGVSVVGGGETSLPGASGGTSSSAGTAPAQGEYKPEEERALKYMCGFSLLETLHCQSHLKRFCSVDELAEGVQLEPGKVFGFEKGYDPRRDPNYEYRVTAEGDSFEVHAVPRKPGLGGFYDDARGPIRYNPKGEASVQDKRVNGGVSCPTVIRFPVRQIEVE